MPKGDPRPIGIFDSGVGGLTVANAIKKRLPMETLIYFGDTAHLPYGEKSADAIRYFSLKICHYLLEKDCKAIVVACNSASTTAHNVLLDFFKDKAVFIDVVHPLVEYVSAENPKSVGLIATHATIKSGVYQKMLQNLDTNMQLQAIATPLLAPMIEEGFVDDEVSEAVLRAYVDEGNLTNVEMLLLACTHYPLIKNEIARHLPSTTIVDSTDLAAIALEVALQRKDLLVNERGRDDEFVVSDYTDNFRDMARRFFGEAIDLKVESIW